MSSAAAAEPMRCWKCLGCGQVADTARQEPWSAWEPLPRRSTVAVALGLVRPVTCLECDGTGQSQ